MFLVLLMGPLDGEQSWFRITFWVTNGWRLREHSRQATYMALSIWSPLGICFCLLSEMGYWARWTLGLTQLNHSCCRSSRWTLDNTSPQAGHSTPGIIVAASFTMHMALKSLIPSGSQILTSGEKRLESGAVLSLLILKVHDPNHSAYCLFLFLKDLPPSRSWTFPFCQEKESKQTKLSTMFHFFHPRHASEYFHHICHFSWSISGCRSDHALYKMNGWKWGTANVHFIRDVCPQTLSLLILNKYYP